MKKIRNIVIKLTSERKKSEIFRNKLKLKGSSIFIENDYTKEDLQKKYSKLPKNKKCQ